MENKNDFFKKNNDLVHVGKYGAWKKFIEDNFDSEQKVKEIELAVTIMRYLRETSGEPKLFKLKRAKEEIIKFSKDQEQMERVARIILRFSFDGVLFYKYFQPDYAEHKNKYRIVVEQELENDTIYAQYSKQNRKK